MDFALDDLVDHKRIVALDVTPVPAPPHSRYPGLHLLVNCHYDVSMAQQAPADLLELARTDALDVIRRLAAEPQLGKHVSVLVTIYGHFPCTGARPARRRIYRLNILTEELLASGAAMTPTNLATMNADESSELEAVAELLQAPAH